MKKKTLNQMIAVVSCMFLIHAYPVDFSSKLTSPFVNLGISCIVYFHHIHFILSKITHLSDADSVDPDQAPHFVASDVGLQRSAIFNGYKLHVR